MDYEPLTAPQGNAPQALNPDPYFPGPSLGGAFRAFEQY